MSKSFSPLSSFVRRILPACFLTSSFVFATAGVSFGQVQMWDKPAPTLAAAARATILPGIRSEITSGRSMPALESLKVAAAVEMPLPGGKRSTGRVNLNRKDASGWQRTAGSIDGAPGSSFSLSERGSEVRGLVRLRGESKAYVIEGRKDGTIEITEKPLGMVECLNMPRPRNEPMALRTSNVPVGAQPSFSSRPDAEHVLFIDFDGEVVTDPQWNDGNTINATPSGMSDEQIAEAWQQVAEDFRPFEIDVTTDPSRYDAVPPGKRMRCIVTPTETARPGAGGVALFNSFRDPGSDTTPCWAFVTGSGKSAGEVISHEFGHTLNLAHDGRPTPPGEKPDDYEYFAGHGNWAPIMGVGYDKAIVQWSKGEYNDANNTEDDTAIIADNGFELAADDASGAVDGSDNIDAPTGAVVQTGVVSSPTDADVFRIPSTGGAINVTGTPTATSPNLDIQLVLMNANGKEIMTSDVVTPDLTANIKMNLAKGDYYLLVRGSGFGAPLTDGYSPYGSIGQYRLSGTIPGKSFPTGNLQPDLLIGKGKSRVGEGLFGKLPQEYQIEFGKKKKIKITAILANIGLLEERFNLRTSGRFSGHKYSISVKGQNVTKPMKSGGSKTHILKPGQKLKIDIVFLPKRSLKKEKTLYLNAVALGDKQRTDKLGITLVPAKK